MRAKGFDNLIFRPVGSDLAWARDTGKNMPDSGRGRDWEVRYYSGYKEGETPRALLAAGREFPVERVLSRQRGLDAETGRSFDLFRIQVAGRTVAVRRTEAGRSEILPSSDLSFLDPAG